MTGRSTGALAVLLLLAAGCGGGGTKPNVIVVTIESLRADHVGCYGYPLPTTPNLDRFAGESVRFDEAYTLTSWTLPSHASLLTGLPSSALKVTEPHHKLDDSYETLAELLAGEGYSTAAIVSGPFLRTPYNLNQGFDLYDDTPSAIAQQNAQGDITNPAMERKVIEYLRAPHDEPFFLFAYFWDVHYDFIPPPPYDTMFVTPGMEPFDATRFEMNQEIHPGMDEGRLDYILSQYDGEIRCTDEMFGRILDVLREEGLWETTAILITSDHGEEFFDHGEIGHKHNLHRESLHVPFLLKLPGPARSGVDSSPVSLLDVVPTILDLCGVSVPGEMSGRSLLKKAADARELIHELYITYYRYQLGAGYAGTKTFDAFALREGDFKYMRLPRKGGERLYDITADPLETADLSESLAADLPRWREKVKAWTDRTEAIAAAHGDAEDASLSDEERERLEALGYIRKAPGGR